MQGYGLGKIITPKKEKLDQGSGVQKKKEWKYVNQFLQMERNMPEQKSQFGKDISKQEKERRSQQIYKLLPRHPRPAILKCLKKHRYDISETYNHMIKQPQMAEQNQDDVEKVHVLPSQVCEQLKKENIRGEEFQWIFIVGKSKPQPRSRARKEQVDEDSKHKTLKDIRDELDHLYKHRQSMQIMNGDRKGMPNPQLQHMTNQINPRIASLSRASRILQVQRMEESNPLWINLHGYRQQQIPPLFDHIVPMLRNNPEVKRSTASLVAITGKGKHSFANQSVLKPALKAWCDHNGFQYIEKIDRIILLIPLQ